MKTIKIILKSLMVLFLFAVNGIVNAQTVTQIHTLNLTEQECKDLIYTAKGTLAEEEPNLYNYIDESQIPKISKFILHISIEKSRSLPSYHRFSGAHDGSIFYKVELPCSAKTYEEEQFEYPYVAIIYIWEETHRPFAMICGNSGIGSTIF